VTTSVDEVRGNYRLVADFHTDNHLVFPNVQTCLATVGKMGAELTGVHMTIGERNPSQDFRKFFDYKFANCTAIYLIGGVRIAPWTKAQMKAAVGKTKAKVFYYDASGWVNLAMANGGVTVDARVNGAEAVFSMTKADGSAAQSIQGMSKL